MRLFDLFKKKAPKVTIVSHEYSPAELRHQREQEICEIRKLAKEAYPSKNGLRPHEIAMLSSAERYKTSDNHFPQHWYFDYAIDNPQELLNTLLKRGFIRVETAKEGAAHLKVSELRALLSGFGVSEKGKKSDLRTTIQKSISEQDLDDKIPIRYYALTELGEQELKENEYVTYFGSSRKYGLTVWDMNKMLQDYPHGLFRDRILASLNESEYKAMEHLSKTRDFYTYYRHKISLSSDMCHFLMEESLHLKDAVRHLAISTFYDVMVSSVISFQTSWKYRDRDKEPPTFREQAHIQYNAKTFFELQKALTLSDTGFKNLLIEFFSAEEIQYSMLEKWKVCPINISVSELADLIVAEMKDDENTASAIYRKIEKSIRAWKC